MIYYLAHHFFKNQIPFFASGGENFKAHANQM